MNKIRTILCQILFQDQRDCNTTLQIFYNTLIIKKTQRRHIELWSKLSHQREWQLTDTNKDKKRQRINYGVVTQVAARYVRHGWLKSFNLFVKVNSVFSFRSTSLMWQKRPDAYKLCILACVSFQSTCDFCWFFFFSFLSPFSFLFLYFVFCYSERC